MFSRSFTSFLPRKLISTITTISNTDSLDRSAMQDQLSSKRAISILQAQLKDTVKTTPLMSKEEIQNFLEVFPDIICDLTNEENLSDVPDVTKWFAKVLLFNVPTGKKVKGFTLVSSYKTLEKSENLTRDNMKKAYILGWCIELITAYILMIDDIMDSSETRRGLPCWYKNKEVELQAINDALLIKGGAYCILQKYFSNLPCYVPILELIQEIDFKTSIGQTLDCKTYKDGRPDLDNFTVNKLKTIVKYKAAYSLINSVKIAMVLAGIYDRELHRQATTILLEMTDFFQAQNDFLDAFDDLKVSKKIGNDIREGKCSWVVVEALKRASSEQKNVLRQHYGVKTAESERIVMDLYVELGIPKIFRNYEEEAYNNIKAQIQKISKGLPPEMFLKIIHQIYPRNN